MAILFLARVANDNASWLDQRGALTPIASKLAPTGNAVSEGSLERYFRHSANTT